MPRRARGLATPTRSGGRASHRVVAWIFDSPPDRPPGTHRRRHGRDRALAVFQPRVAHRRGRGRRKPRRARRLTSLSSSVGQPAHRVVARIFSFAPQRPRPNPPCLALRPPSPPLHPFRRPFPPRRAPRRPRERDRRPPRRLHLPLRPHRLPLLLPRARRQFGRPALPPTIRRATRQERHLRGVHRRPQL